VVSKEASAEKKATPTPPPVNKTAPLEIRLGVISYDAYNVTYKKYYDFLNPLSEAKANRLNRKIIFRLAVGSYSDVIDWYIRGRVDLVMLTPEPTIELQKLYGDEELRRLYVASHSTLSSATPQFEYRAMCLVNQNSPIKDYQELLAWARQGRLSLLLVHPLSASGGILPRYVLSRQNHIENIAFNATKKPNQNMVTWTYGPAVTGTTLQGADESGLSLEDPSSGRAQVGFTYVQKIPDGLRRIPFPGLDEVEIPEEVVFIHQNFLRHKADMETLFDVRNSSSSFQNVPDWLGKFKNVAQWVDELKVSSHDPESQNITLDQLGNILRNYEGRNQQPARVAMVLSGGGAKCAYQLGAIEAVEDEISKVPENVNEKKVDINLVVGTSGGAINALLVALGKTRGGKGQETRANNGALESMWKDFDQRDFFHPWAAVYVALGLSVGLLEAVFLMALSAFIIRYREKRNHQVRGLYLYPVFALCLTALFNFALYLFDLRPPWKYMGAWGMNHSVRNLWLVLTLNLEVSGLTLCVLAVALVIWWQFHPHTMNRTSLWVFQRQLRLAFIVGLIAVIGLSLFYETTVSQSDGVEKTLSNKISKLVTSATGSNPEDLTKSNQLEDKLHALSKQVEGKLERDLIITGSRLTVDEEVSNIPTLPPDLYFYYDSKHPADKPQPVDDGPNPPVPSDPRFQPFGDFLMDVVIGSASIYPVFPFRPLKNFHDTLQVDIIDGGFVHNSPIDAAVSWNATHIILIEASPLVTPRQSSLWDNSTIAFNHLYNQAQILDSRARGKVEIFTLRPLASTSADKPDLSTFDFSADMIGPAIQRGLDDASSIQPHFHRAPGEPFFRTIGSEVNE